MTYKEVIIDLIPSRAFLFGENNMSRFIRGDKAPLCACGCGERAGWNKGKKKWNKFIFRHSLKTSKYRGEYNKRVGRTIKEGK